jgi:uncharacterized phage-associated protein
MAHLPYIPYCVRSRVRRLRLLVSGTDHKEVAKSRLVGRNAPDVQSLAVGCAFVRCGFRNVARDRQSLHPDRQSWRDRACRRMRDPQPASTSPVPEQAGVGTATPQAAVSLLRGRHLCRRIILPESLQPDSHMIIPFDPLKAVQAAAVLLREEEGKMSRLRLLNLLYIADRESIAETLRPITGDDISAMDHGPVPSKTYHLIRRRSGPSTQIWDEFIAQQGDRDHVLIKDPGDGCLSAYEIMKLRGVCAMRRGMKDYEIADETHKFPEWIRNQPPEGSSQRISLHDILAELMMEDYEEGLSQEEEAEIAFDKALATVRES